MIPRFSLRTLIAVMLLGGPALAVSWFALQALRPFLSNLGAGVILASAPMFVLYGLALVFWICLRDSPGDEIDPTCDGLAATATEENPYASPKKDRPLQSTPSSRLERAARLLLAIPAATITGWLGFFGGALLFVDRANPGRTNSALCIMSGIVAASAAAGTVTWMMLRGSDD